MEIICLLNSGIVSAGVENENTFLKNEYIQNHYSAALSSMFNVILQLKKGVVRCPFIMSFRLIVCLVVCNK